MTFSIVGISAGDRRESDLAFGLQEGDAILITKPPRRRKTVSCGSRDQEVHQGGGVRAVNVSPG
ncbi:hypothetical protein LO771_21250 [Streptacidiphilus sp. ASG 303]|uniref:hypothetical protein n=1 Tax=Streptacidiphilus sp. ASG 303 TaxID=2896847 RepID=UPI001E456F77|nr:hypothetical protein [Streptacidiphilus sp. ASG 303]MCD0484849.1 hypothetical protein [Streptacidiphilus sp. ASG 303]